MALFGFGRTKPVSVTPFTDERPRTFNTLWCDGVIVRNLPSFSALMAMHAELSQARAPLLVLATLDDLGQAGYTSGHVVEAQGLVDWDEEDAWDGEGEMPPPPLRNDKALATCLSRIDAASPADIEGMRGQLPWQADYGVRDLITLNRDPDQVMQISGEREILFQFVPVGSAAEMIAAFPNGYFQGDLSPMQNLALARHMQREHGLELFGMGSRFLAFRRAAPFAGDGAGRAASDALAIYAEVPDGAAASLTSVLTGRDWLLIRYTEG